MHKRFLIAFLFALAIPAWAMKPQEPAKKAIPADIASDYDQEKRRFEKYDLDHPEKFLNRLRADSNKDKDPFLYLRLLQLFASKLLVQHILIQLDWNEIYFLDHFNKLIVEHLKYAEKIGVKKEGANLYIVTENDEQLNELLAHSHLLGEEIYSSDDLKTVFSWILDPAYEEFFHIFGQDRLITNEGYLTKALLKEHENALDEFIVFVIQTQFQESSGYPQIIKQNSAILIKLYENIETYMKKIKKVTQYKKEDISPIIVGQHVAKAQKLIALYEAASDWYQKLYRIVRKEIDDTIRELISAHEPKGDLPFLQKLKQYTFSLPEPLRNANLFLEKLPDQLPNLINPKGMPLPSYKEQFEQFRLQWEKEHPKGEEKKKEVIKPKKARIKKPKVKKEPLDQPCLAPASIEKEAEEPIETEEAEQEFFENDKNIVILNTENQTTEIIFKTDAPFQIKQQLPPFKYTRWVMMWFKNPAHALCIQGYTNPESRKFTPDYLRWRPVALHAFSPLVDTFINQWGTLTMVANRKNKNRLDYEITIPGKIIYNTHTLEKGKNSETGLYVYLIDSSNGQWYHRMFEPQKGEQLMRTFLEKGYFMRGDSTGYFDEFFPPLKGT